MNNEEKNLLEEIWSAVGLDMPQDQPTKTPPEKEPEPQATPEIEPVSEAPAEEAKEPPVEEVKEAPVEEPKKEAPVEEPKKEAEVPKELVQEKKKDIRFLMIYTVAFVVVISFLIGGSYLITSRIRREMAESNQELNTNQSTLKNIQVENQNLRKENESLKQKNDLLTQSQQDSEALLTAVADMVEHGEYLSAAQDAYLRGDRNLARTILSTIERDKLSEPAKNYYDTLAGRLG